MENFDERATVITGGANGIGFATAREFARRGARVMLGDIDRSALDDAVAILRADGVDAYGVVCDVRKLDDVERLADEAFRVFGDVHVVFNNAGIAYAGPIVDTSHDDWRFVIDVDLWGPIHGVEAFLPRLIAQGGRAPHRVHVVVRGVDPQRWTRTVLRCEIRCGRARRDAGHGSARPNGIGVSVLCPMIVETDLLANTERVRSADYGAGHPLTGRDRSAVGLGPPPTIPCSTSRMSRA